MQSKICNNKIRKLYRILYYQLLKRHIFAITGPLRVLPDFIVIGAVRSGTTSLFHYFGEHPCISPSSYDELGFFDSNFELGLNWYRSNFPTRFHKQKIILKEGHFLTYDVTPFYIWNKEAAKRIATTLPNVKIIALLRNPIDRAYSNFQLSVRNGEKRSFEEMIKIEIQDIKSCENNNEIFLSKSAGLENFLVRGVYYEQLLIWFRLFSKDQILVMSTEELEEQPDNTLNTMFRFLGVRNYTVKDLKKRNEIKYQPMKNETRVMLIEFFRKHNDKLFKLLNKQFDWNR